MPRSSHWLAQVLVGLAACRPHATADGPEPRRERSRARAVAAPAVIDLAAGPYRTCAIRASGELRCWGDNGGGRLGDGTERTRRYPHPVHGIDDAVQVALGSSHACARHRDGRVSCWGSGSAGQLGDGAREDRRTPVAVTDLRDAVDVGTGSTHACAVRADGSVWCWGSNDTGELGDGTRLARPTPVAVEGLPRARRVRPGRGFTCALLRDDSVWCWGSDADGLTGAPEPASRCGDQEWSPACLPAPRAPVPLPPAIDLVVGDEHACAVTREGQVLCWGGTFGCEQGRSQVERIRAPQVLESLPPVAALAGPQCAHARSGDLVCWGRDRTTPDPSYDPGSIAFVCTAQRVVPTLARRATRISAHERGGCALVDGDTGPAPQGSLWCWGDGSRGQLGDGSEVSRPAGVEVVALDEPPPPAGPTPLQHMTAALVRAGVPDHGHALVWHDAPVFADATAEQPVGSIAETAPELRVDSYTALLPVRIVAAHGERLEVEPIGPADARAHCDASSFVGFERYALRMFVQAEDLAPVVAREYAMGYPDGSGVTLGAGMPLRPLEAGVVARAGSLVLPLELTEGDASLTYDSPGLERSATSKFSWELPTLAANAVLTLDDRRVYLDELDDPLDRVRWLEPEEAGVARVHTESRCVGLDLVADDPVPTEPPTMGVMGTMGGTEVVSFTRVREGAAAYWPGGAPAGQLGASYRTREAPRPDGERRCLTLAGKLPICHDVADLSTETVELPFGFDDDDDD